MRLLYAVQFDVALLESDKSSDVTEQVLHTLASWISDWYLSRRNLQIDFPMSGGNLQLCRSHELTVTREMLGSGRVGRSTVSWSYPDDNDGNLFWHSRCEISTFHGLNEFSFQLFLESTQFYIAPVEFSLRRPRIIATLLRQFVCSNGSGRLSVEPRAL